MNEESLFHEALTKPVSERAAFLEAACAGNEKLRADVEALLVAHEASQHPLDQPLQSELEATKLSSPAESGPATGDSVTPPAPLSEASPVCQPTATHVGKTQTEVIIAGRYTLQEKLGEGGMGEVWVAKQTEPVKRRVALKLIKLGMDSKAIVQRFGQERQALAIMDHPHIARVLDGGMTETGQPFFVMELVNGLPLTKFCDEAKLGVRERLELFVPICQAVQHAHQKGIVHRDLKPANILVTMIDGQPVPKVIDFGVAKATGGKLTDESMSTQFGAIVGTLEYMSPEQAGFSGQDIDTRADIYSLGVILYELLTGLRPIDAARLKEAAITEMIRIIREEEPSKPSTRLSTDESLPSLAAVRQTEPRKLTALLRGELDWVVMKCLEKQRDRRYETANALVRDIQRYLSDEPVEARPPSLGYRAEKFLRRNKGPVIAASLVVFALIGGIVGTTWGLFEASHQADVAENRRKEAQAAQKRAEAAAAKEQTANIQAQKRLAQIEKANDILGSIFENLDPKEIAKAERPLQAILVEKLDQAVAQLEGESIGDPLVVAAMQNKFGLSLLSLGEPSKAIVLLEKSRATHQATLGVEHLDTLASMHNLATAYHSAGKLDLALPLFEESLKLMKAKLGSEHPNTLTSMGNLAATYQYTGKLDLALPLFEETLKLRKAKLGPKHPATLISIGNLATAYRAAGKLDLALPLFEESLARMKATLGPEHPDTLHSMDNLATAYHAAGKLNLALPIFEETLTLRKARLGPEHPDTLASMHNLAAAYHSVGKRHLALPLLEETHRLREATLGPDHRDTLTNMSNLATAYRDAGKLDLALPLIEESLARRKTTLGPEHPDTLTSMKHLAGAYHEAGKWNLAMPLREEVLKLSKKQLGLDHPDTLRSINDLATAYWNLMQLDKSVPLFEEALKRQEAKLGRNHANTQATVANLGVNYKDAGRLNDAIPLLEEANRAAKQFPELRFVGQSLLDAYAKAGENTKFATLLQEQLSTARQALPMDSPQLAGLLAQISLVLLDQKKWTDAEPLLRECLAIRKMKEPDDWKTFNTQSLLGGALLGQKKYADAGPLLLAGYEGMKAHEDQIPPQAKIRLIEAVNRLVELYTALDKPDELNKWKTEREKYPAKSQGNSDNPTKP